MLTFRHTGDWGPGEIETRWAESTRAVVPEVEEAVERAWEATLRRPGVHLFDGPMCRLEEATVTPPPTPGPGAESGSGRLRLVLSPTSSKVFLGTNLTHPEFADRHGRGVLASPVGVSPALETADGFLLLGRRSTSVAYYPGRVHPFAGALEPRDAGDVFAAVRRELREELSLEESDVTELRCTGLVEDGALRQPELVFRAGCPLTRAEVEARLDPVEHRGTWSAGVARERLEAALADDELTPVALASLLLWGRVRFGDEWFSQHRAGR